MAPGSDNSADLAVLVRAADPDRYLSVLYAPADRRGALLALYAFNAEIAIVRDKVREPMAGEIRLQWWRDALAGDRRNEAAANPLAASLNETLDRYDLPRAALDRYLQARLFDLYDEEFPDRTTLEGYCGETAGTIIQLASMVLDRDAAASAGEAAGHAACAQAIAGILRSLPRHRARGQCYVPAEVLKACGTDRDRFIAGDDKATAQAVVSAMVAMARDHLGRFRGLTRTLPRTFLPAYLPLAPVGACLDRIEKQGGSVLDHVVDISPVRRNWLMMWRAARGY